MGGGGSGSSSSLLFKALFGTLIVLGFILVVLVGTLQSEGYKTKMTSTTDHDRSSPLPWTGKLLKQEEQVKAIGKGKSSRVRPQLDLNYMSNRKVPNGPDPIHNRRSGNSGRPPGQA